MVTSGFYGYHGYIISKQCIDAFMIKVMELQIIFKVITGSSGHAFWLRRTVLHSIKMFSILGKDDHVRVLSVHEG